MRRIVMSLAAALAIGCAPAEEAENLAPGCDARAAQAWNATPEAALSVEAVSFGPDCDRGVATLVIRDSSGAPLYADTHFTGHVMTLAGATDQATMQAALMEWLNSSNATMATTSALPEWPENAEGPVSGEFPFYPEEGVDRAAYLSLRQQDAPLFCYVQGMESQKCVAFVDDGVASVGVQTFPG